ncbi:hypothetical protein CRE_27694 [Caenorhabditis remanei]|uniref:Uncharacterized protein n=1 Tax=Caenorhabditis remanei TaxID=31234 RepID=E3MKK0_CAERE|nr:hypothetical protein CRE_27694 [Caenorhabditis remanei]
MLLHHFITMVILPIVILMLYIPVGCTLSQNEQFDSFSSSGNRTEFQIRQQEKNSQIASAVESDNLSEKELFDLFSNLENNGPDSYNFSMNSYFEANRLIEELSLTVPTERWLQIVKMIENRDLDGLNQLRNSIKKASSTTLSLDPDASNSKKEFQGTRGTKFSTASTTMIEKTKEGRHQITSDVEQTSIINFSTTPLFFKVVAMTIIITFIIVLLILFVLAFKFMSSYPAVRRDVKPTLVGSIKVATVDLKNPRILADREFTTLIFHSLLVNDVVGRFYGKRMRTVFIGDPDDDVYLFQINGQSFLHAVANNQHIFAEIMEQSARGQMAALENILAHVNHQ